MGHRPTGATEAQIDYCACEDPEGCRKMGCPFEDCNSLPNGSSVAIMIMIVMAFIVVGVVYAALQLFQLLQDLVR